MNVSLADSYRPAMFSAVGIQLVCGVLSAMLLDGGNAAALCFCTLIGFWAGVVMLVLRCPRDPEPTDLWVVRYGFLPLFGVAFFLMELYISVQ
ncbi:MAG: hypothetical protein H7Y43_03040 [Akkermansiaceae bacterium]|nr:hypothetical protein [Verrucomicrobiales bacterium]